MLEDTGCNHKNSTEDSLHDRKPMKREDSWWSLEVHCLAAIIQPISNVEDSLDRMLGVWIAFSDQLF